MLLFHIAQIMVTGESKRGGCEFGLIFFNYLILTWWLTQPLTEMSTKNFPWGKSRTVRKTDNLTAIWEQFV
jgi:hypothetical protein